MSGSDADRSQSLSGSSRRQFLAGAAAWAGAAALPRLAGAAAPGRLIDVHHHFEPTLKNKDGDAWSIQRSLDQLDSNGVTAAIAYAGPLFASDPQAARKTARETNEWSTQHCLDHKGRFGLFASLPMNNVDAALEEIAYAFDVLKADGIGLATQYGEAWLGDAKFEPIFAELNRRKAVVYVHPSEAPCCTPATLSYEKPPVATAWIEFPMNTARTILSLWASQTTLRMRDIRFLFCHGGGVLPILVGRIAGFDDWRAVGPEKLKQLFPDGVYAEFAKLHFECAQAFAPETFAMLQKLVPPDNLLFGTDYSYFPVAHSVRLFNNLSLSPAVRSGIASGNAGALLPRWRV